MRGWPHLTRTDLIRVNPDRPRGFRFRIDVERMFRLGIKLTTPPVRQWCLVKHHRAPNITGLPKPVHEQEISGVSLLGLSSKWGLTVGSHHHHRRRLRSNRYHCGCRVQLQREVQDVRLVAHKVAGLLLAHCHRLQAAEELYNWYSSDS